MADIDRLGVNGPLDASAGQDSLFNCLFGRDSMRMAMDLLDDFPAVARTTLLELAQLQGVRLNPRGEEESGKILHEHREMGDPMLERLQTHWDFPYFGAADSTPLWVSLLGDYCSNVDPTFIDQMVVDRLGRSVSIAECLNAATEWILRRLDGPTPGYVSSRRATPHSLVNQSWTDSWDAFYYEDGALFDPDASRVVVEVQGNVYDALIAAAGLLESGSDLLRQAADGLHARLLRDFWMEDEGMFATAATARGDGSLRVSRVIGSNPGQLLASGVLDGPELASIRERLVARVLAPDMLAAAGIRTKSVNSPRFHPGSYHNGSTWPMDTGIISDGLRRAGYQREADDLDERIIQACLAVEGFPEFFRGDPDGVIRVNTRLVDVTDPSGQVNRLEQPPQLVQGWTVTRVWRILRRRNAIAHFR